MSTKPHHLSSLSGGVVVECINLIWKGGETMMLAGILLSFATAVAAAVLSHFIITLLETWWKKHHGGS